MDAVPLLDGLCMLFGVERPRTGKFSLAQWNES